MALAYKHVQQQSDTCKLLALGPKAAAELNIAARGSEGIVVDASIFAPCYTKSATHQAKSTSQLTKSALDEQAHTNRSSSKMPYFEDLEASEVLSKLKDILVYHVFEA